MIRALFDSTLLPDAPAPYHALQVKAYYPAAPSGSERERMTGQIPADRTRAPLPVVIFLNGINIGIESYHWLALELTGAGFVTVLYTHIAETLPGVIGLTPGIDLAQARPETYGSAPTCPAIAPILDLLARWNAQEGHPLHQMLDLERVALGGHSAGGTVALQSARFFPQVQAVFAYAGHTMASTLLGFPPETVLPVCARRILLLHGDRDGVIAASRARYGTDSARHDPVSATFEAASAEEIWQVLIPGANHFSIAHPVDETSGRIFLDEEMTRPAAELRAQIASLILTFLQGREIQGEPHVMRQRMAHLR